VVLGQSIDEIRFQNDLGFVLSQGLTPFTTQRHIIKIVSDLDLSNV